MCSGNICRSVVAEHLFRRMTEDGVKVSSAGVCASRSGVPLKLLKVAREYGIDLSEHIGRQLNREMVEDADLILTMERFHKQIISEVFPWASNKVHTLKGYVYGKDDDVEDPYYDASEERFRACIEELIPILQDLRKIL